MRRPLLAAPSPVDLSSFLLKIHTSQDNAVKNCRGIDYLKEDSCNAPSDHPTAFEEYGRMRDALNATGRPIFFSLCGWNAWVGQPRARPTINAPIAAGSFFSFVPSLSTVRAPRMVPGQLVAHRGGSQRMHMTCCHTLNQHRLTCCLMTPFAARKQGDCNAWPSIYNAIRTNEVLANYSRPGGFNDPDSKRLHHPFTAQHHAPALLLAVLNNLHLSQCWSAAAPLLRCTTPPTRPARSFHCGP